MLGHRGIRATLKIATATAVAILGLTSCSDAKNPTSIRTSALGRQPNIVMILTDDLSSDLINFMPHVLQLQKAGLSFTNYTVTDSLCCPSRSSIFTGEFPHDTQVYSNSGIDGGFHMFHRTGDEDHTFATAMQAAGYRTALMGKYLNGYIPYLQYADDGLPEAGSDTWVPPGWDDWQVAGNGYHEQNYALNDNHVVRHYGFSAHDYMTNVISRLGSQFITSSADDHKPFMLELATFAPHSPATPAPGDRHKFSSLLAPHTLAWDRVPAHAPAWLAHHPKLRAKDIRLIDRDYRQRVRCVQAVDRMVASVEQTLQRTGQAKNTVFVFTSDNGYHLGQWRLRPGKLTAFDTDVNVPLIVSGPHIPADRTNTDLVQNIDLAPTFESLAGINVPSTVDGHSIVSLLTGDNVPWRSTGLIEHHGPDFAPDDPDQQSRMEGNPPTYEALRTATYTYVQYRNGEHEYYDRVLDPDELDNRYGSLSNVQRETLEHRVQVLQDCHGAAQCWESGDVRHADS